MTATALRVETASGTGAALRATAAAEGAAAALRQLLDAASPDRGVARWLLLPAELEPDAAERRGEVGTDTEPLALWRASALASAPAADDGWPRGIGWIRLGLGERLLAAATDRLRRRLVGTTAIVNLPPVRLIIADTTMAHLEAEALLGADEPLDTAALAHLSRRLDDAVRGCLHLLAAAGYVDAPAGRLARASELLGHAEPTSVADPGGAPR